MRDAAARRTAGVPSRASRSIASVTRMPPESEYRSARHRSTRSPVLNWRFRNGIAFNLFKKSGIPRLRWSASGSVEVRSGHQILGRQHPHDFLNGGQPLRDLQYGGVAELDH